MKIKTLNWLFIIDILTLLLILAVVLIPSNVIRIVIGLPFLLFFPGFVLIEALFSVKGIDGIERIALSFGMSLAITALIGLGLNYTAWGIRLIPVLLSISAFIFAISGVAWLRLHKLSGKENLTVKLPVRLPGWEGSAFNKSLSVILAVTIVGTIGVLVYTVAAPKVGERFTEFYILGNGGKAEGYPSVFVMDGNKVVSVQYGGTAATSEGSRGIVTLGIVNHEQQNASYRVALKVDGQTAEIYYSGKSFARLEQIELPQGGKWEQDIGFVPGHPGENQKVEFMLFKNNEADPENSLHLWVDVKEK